MIYQLQLLCCFESIMIRLMMYCTKGVVRAGVGTDGQSLYGDTHTAVCIITPQTTIVEVILIIETATVRIYTCKTCTVCSCDYIPHICTLAIYEYRIHPCPERYKTCYVLHRAGHAVLGWSQLSKCPPGRSLSQFQVFTKALAFPKGYKGSHIPLRRDIP